MSESMTAGARMVESIEQYLGTMTFEEWQVKVLAATFKVYGELSHEVKSPPTTDWESVARKTLIAIRVLPEEK